MSDALVRGLIEAQVAEALANYQVADAPLTEAPPVETTHVQADFMFCDDREFWRRVLPNADQAAAPFEIRNVEIYYVAVTEWVARVPGLYWLPGADKIRRVHPSQIESEVKGWRIYRPKGKSQQVAGGVGTLRFPPSDDGYHLVTLTAFYNASTGVPALVSPDVWEQLHLKEGGIIETGHAYWQAMPYRWAVQFPIIQQIPRGCLILNQPHAIQCADQGAPIQVHPFSVMEYWDGPAQLHDFVYATADSTDKRFRHELPRFFEAYRKARDREGTYLTAADITEPMWDAAFASPEEMRKSKDAQLRLIEERVEDVVNGVDVAEALVKKLSHAMDLTDLKRLCIEWRRWSRDGNLSDEAARLVDAAIRASKQQALLYALQLELPE